MKKASLYLSIVALGLSNVALADDFADQIFSETITGEIQALSDEEMQSTEGEFGLPGALAGAALGTWGYAGYLATGGQFTYDGAFTNIAGGAAGGFFTGPGSAAARYAANRAVAGVGAVGGVIASSTNPTLVRSPEPVQRPAIQSAGSNRIGNPFSDLPSYSHSY